MKIVPIGLIHSPFKDTGGTPIQPHYAKGVRGTVEIEPKFAEGLRDLDGFERIWLIYWFHRSRSYELMVVPYRDTVPRGLFATRAPSRPNGIGLSSVKLLEVSGNRLIVEDIDILDETPLLDIKPYVPFARVMPTIDSMSTKTIDSPRNNSPSSNGYRHNRLKYMV